MSKSNSKPEHSFIGADPLVWAPNSTYQKLIACTPGPQRKETIAIYFHLCSLQGEPTPASAITSDLHISARSFRTVTEHLAAHDFIRIIHTASKTGSKGANTYKINPYPEQPATILVATITTPPSETDPKPGNNPNPTDGAPEHQPDSSDSAPEHQPAESAQTGDQSPTSPIVTDGAPEHQPTASSETGDQKPFTQDSSDGAPEHRLAGASAQAQALDSSDKNNQSVESTESHLQDSTEQETQNAIDLESGKILTDKKQQEAPGPEIGISGPSAEPQKTPALEVPGPRQIPMFGVPIPPAPKASESYEPPAKKQKRQREPKPEVPTKAPPPECKTALATLLYGHTNLMARSWAAVVKLWNELECPTLKEIENAQTNWKDGWQYERSGGKQLPTYGQLIEGWDRLKVTPGQVANEQPPKETKPQIPPKRIEYDDSKLPDC